MLRVLLPTLLLRAVLLPTRLLPAGRRQASRSGERKVLLTMGDTATMAEDIWHSLSHELRAFLRSRLPTAADADDVLQEVFVRVVEKLGSLRQPARIEPWVYQIARNAIVDFYRRRAPRPDDSVENAAEPCAEDDPANQNRPVGAWLMLMIARLPETLRDAVRMYEIDGLSQAEIANRLGISLSGAKSRVQRGRRHLAQILRGSCQLQLDRRGNVIDCQPATLGECHAAPCECNDGSREVAS